jgi:hypothetical protein
MSNFTPSADILTLREYIKTAKPDQTLTYSQIAGDTGISMDKTGKNHLRAACKTEKIEYTPLVGEGIVIAGPVTGCKIVETRIHGAKRAIKRSARSHAIISAKHLANMSQDDQKKVVFVGAVFAAMTAASESLKQLQPAQAPVAIAPVLPA